MGTTLPCFVLLYLHANGKTACASPSVSFLSSAFCCMSWDPLHVYFPLGEMTSGSSAARLHVLLLSSLCLWPDDPFWLLFRVFRRWSTSFLIYFLLGLSALMLYWWPTVAGCAWYLTQFECGSRLGVHWWGCYGLRLIQLLHCPPTII